MKKTEPRQTQKGALETLLFAVACVFIAASAFLAISARAETVERIVAIVNDEIITQTDLDKYAERIRSGELLDDLLIPDAATKQTLLSDRNLLLQNLIDAKVIDSETKKENLSVPVERVEQEIRTVAKNNNVSRDDLKAALKERGIDFSIYQDFIKTGLEHRSLVEKAIQSKIKISEDDVNSAFTAIHGPADQAFEYTLAHIFFRSDKGGASAAKARAEDTLKKLKSGISFERLAAETSEDANFEDGGMLGIFKTGELEKNLDLVVQKLSPGEFTGVLPAPEGFHIVRVTKKKLIPDPRTEKEREHIRAELYDKTFKRQLKSWLETLRQEAFVRLNPK